LNIDQEYKRRFAELTEQLGREPNTRDKEYWELSDWARNEWEARKVPAHRESDTVVPDSESQVGKSIPGSERVCRDCGVPIVKKPGRGRPPVRCEDCREKVNA